MLAVHLLFLLSVIPTTFLVTVQPPPSPVDLSELRAISVVDKRLLLFFGDFHAPQKTTPLLYQLDQSDLTGVTTRLPLHDAISQPLAVVFPDFLKKRVINFDCTNCPINHTLIFNDRAANRTYIYLDYVFGASTKSNTFAMTFDFLNKDVADLTALTDNWNEIWISSFEPNIFYSWSKSERTLMRYFHATNITHWHEHAIWTEAYYDYSDRIMMNTPMWMCTSHSPFNATTQPQMDGILYFSTKKCQYPVDWHFETGFVDRKWFYLIGKTKVYVFSRLLFEDFDPGVKGYYKQLDVKDFFGGKSRLPNGTTATGIPFDTSTTANSTFFGIALVFVIVVALLTLLILFYCCCKPRSKEPVAPEPQNKKGQADQFKENTKGKKDKAKPATSPKGDKQSTKPKKKSKTKPVVIAKSVTDRSWKTHKKPQTVTQNDKSNKSSKKAPVEPTTNVSSKKNPKIGNSKKDSKKAPKPVEGGLNPNSGKQSGKGKSTKKDKLEAFLLSVKNKSKKNDNDNSTKKSGEAGNTDTSKQKDISKSAKKAAVNGETSSKKKGKDFSKSAKKQGLKGATLKKKDKDISKSTKKPITGGENSSKKGGHISKSTKKPNAGGAGGGGGGLSLKAKDKSNKQPKDMNKTIKK